VQAVRKIVGISLSEDYRTFLEWFRGFLLFVPSLSWQLIVLQKGNGAKIGVSCAHRPEEVQAVTVKYVGVAPEPMIRKSILSSQFRRVCPEPVLANAPFFETIARKGVFSFSFPPLLQNLNDRLDILTHSLKRGPRLLRRCSFLSFPVLVPSLFW
jgi:hypothetical protein